ncbi:hypothetical protein BDC45DRAFT_568290 [Circinella umbellata]|nr:hypothetical protein BDC45DRAFT_568290 [Circinella umbellata]
MHSFSSSFVLLQLIRQNTKRFYTTKRKYQCKPTQELEHIYRLATLINETQSNKEKADQLLKYPACHAILRRIYDPHLRHHISSKSILAHVRLLEKEQHQEKEEEEPPIQNLKELLDALSSRRLSGKAALNATATFYFTFCKTDQHKQIFCRILDRNLKMGMSVITIQRLLQQQQQQQQEKQKENDSNSQDQKDLASSKEMPLLFKSVALASTAPWKPPQPVSNKEQQEDEWYASRKLDGVRCIAHVQSPESITFYSRTGRIFHSLQKVKEAIQTRLLSMHHSTDEMVPFILDGEICVYSQEGVDDFLMALRQIRSHQQPMTNPVYEVFDMMNVQGFRQGKDSIQFMDRQQKLKQFIESPQAHLRMVEQIKIDTEKQLETLKNKAIKNGWEGLILRKNVPYEGKRSRNMLKIKEWEDDEYTVKSIETGRMRLPNTGQDTQVMTSVIIEHKGNFVSVGSGFTMQQRIRYFEHPELIIGKSITVRYFSESIGESGQPSLRFPSVKAVFEEGKRTI